ncbi:SRPBCC family protein [Catellatospora tritici]|uniref:SRPBCC family protein n=1 Tax=Catellatospora tritici TaxID=2851566 RepID=UPI001C2D7BB0|nr:SRPBCC family protein [Catellatospora tritici]MBV1852785.1 SRPBCC family protein [Catellatospora tritici]
MNHHTAVPGTLADVQCEPNGQRWTLVFTRDLPHPPHTVWTALTDPRRLSRWAPFDADRDLSGTGGAVLTMVDGDERHDLAAEVLRAEPPVLLVNTWGEDNLRWELVSAPGAGTRLTLRHTMTDRDWLPKVAAGWHLCLDVCARLLDGEPVQAIRGQAALAHGWADLRDAYAAKLGLPATPDQE